MIEKERFDKLTNLLNDNIVVIDGAMGTSIQNFDLSEKDFGGQEYEGCNEYLNIINPDYIKSIHRDHIKAGANIIETNSFGSTPLVLSEYGLGGMAYEISSSASKIAREVAAEYEIDGKMIFVAGSMGPTTKAISVTGGITWDELSEHYYVQAKGLVDGGSDLLLIETSQDTLNVKAALSAIDKLSEELDCHIPTAVQCTIENMGTILGGQDIESFYVSLQHRDLLWIGLNCATGPEFMRDHVRTLASISRFPVAVVPNAGLPDEDGKYNEDPDSLADTIAEYCRYGWINLVGGCCGTTPEHIEKLSCSVENVTPRRLVERRVTSVSGLESFIIDEDTRPVIVGERTNVLGSRKFKRLVSEGKWDEMAEIGRSQVRGGAQIVDVCLQDPDRDEVSDLNTFLEILTKKIKATIMLDTTDTNALAEALKRTPGKCIINSINLEDGEERFISVMALIKKFGSAVVVGCIDEDKQQAQAITRERKLSIAKRSHELLTEKYGISSSDIIFDPLVFPIATGDRNYIRAGVETIEGIRLIKKEIPNVKTILGISNVSFGLPTVGREVLNSVFLYYCVQAGLDMAIVNAELLQRYASIPEDERRLAENLIWWVGDDPIGEFADHFRGKKVARTQEERSLLPLDERIANCVIEGTKEGLIADLTEALSTRSPLNIINGPLMTGMDEVGRLFGNNELIVAEVLGSAESMKFAVNHLEQFMDAEETSAKGTILLATVKGDVHDIGKNLVDIILSNNGYKIINLGIKVPPQDLISAFKDNHPDIIGLSGLLVKSAQMMVETARDLSAAGIQVPLVVGGAALSKRFTYLRISPEYGGLVVYAQDAMDGLSIVNQIQSTSSRQQFIDNLDKEKSLLIADESKRTNSPSTTDTKYLANNKIIPVKNPPVPPDLKKHVIRDFDLSEIFGYINPVMLYSRHLGYRGRFEDALESGETKAKELQSKVREVENIMLARQDITANGIYQFFRCASNGDDILFLSPDGNLVIEKFQFGRQQGSDQLCLSDYIQPLENGVPDYIASFVTTIGDGVRQLASKWMDEGNYLNAHILQALAIEGAEAMAEVVHMKIRTMWGFPDASNLTKGDLFRAQYTGKRYSFGYPACPRLEDQLKLWSLLDPDSSINVTLTEELMMDPEASVSAIVFHHGMAKYFNLNATDAEALEQRIRLK
jgi:5-methyltetrahydrofolate--homocysteine methyltransferase